MRGGGSASETKEMRWFYTEVSTVSISTPFASIIAGMTGSGKTFWVQCLLQQSSQAVHRLFGVIDNGSLRIWKCCAPYIKYNLSKPFPQL